MKSLNILLILITVVLSSSCNKVDDEFSTYVSVLKNGEKWTPTKSEVFFTLNINNITLKCTKQVSNLAEEEIFNLNFDLSDNLETTNLSSYWIYLIGGDGIANKYLITDDSKNSIMITSMDTIKKQITGTFRVKLLRDKFYQHPEDTMSFTEGYFSLNYIEGIALN